MAQATAYRAERRHHESQRGQTTPIPVQEKLESTEAQPQRCSDVRGAAICEVEGGEVPLRMSKLSGFTRFGCYYIPK